MDLAELQEIWKEDPPDDPQADIILFHGVSPFVVSRMTRAAKDLATARILGISLAQSAMLRNYKGPRRLEIIFRPERVFLDGWFGLFQFWSEMDQFSLRKWRELRRLCTPVYKSPSFHSLCGRMVGSAPDLVPDRVILDCYRSTVEAAELNVRIRYSYMRTTPPDLTGDPEIDLSSLAPAGLLAGWYAVEVMLAAKPTFQHLFRREQWT